MSLRNYLFPIPALEDLVDPYIAYNEEFDPSRPWQCVHCQKTFKMKCHVKDHIEGAHVLGLSFSCPYCSFTLSSRHRLRNHVTRQHEAQHKAKQIKISQIEPNI